ncbi:hypothetical protein A2625_05350 [candidate division WOR-1 bacterium RIFCSPHIGHO2_01_FULL_53_15]|uniref:Uncharacterized protein n=1 Tax=candidate division WOR-1 bacterium RIFCSPHIGHO2_01_FULL_53_15 TaxID=1802564 RepID=A0A1F4Q1V0_UNCSA|nr:MAG: hypothetical protein A2625_05350 [candidate division WOR-1 bacterium RIFCSPHIGHO2_01_FULL_53_15]OGC13095.1 MAG: hypothetical protein A3D23_00295 [candidate division WOR-1 bacterium RIFCSPHIGHO2_02_FULL_53_26]
MADPEFNPTEEGKRIAREYLSQRGWAREWRRSLDRQLYPAVQREELEEKERRVDRMQEEAEEVFSREYEKWRKDDSPAGQEVRRGMFELLGKRRDLGFIGQRIVERLKREFTPL